MLVTVGSASLELSDAPVPVQGEAFTGGNQAGSAIACEVRTPDGGILEIGLTQWEHGDLDVRCFSRLAGPLMYDRLVKGARLGVHPKRPGEWDCELGILSHHQTGLPTVVKAAWTDLDSVLGADARDLVLSMGATAAGTKEEVLGDTSRRRWYLVMVGPQDDPLPPLAAYVLTRVLPLMKGFGSSAAVPVGQA